MYCVDLTESFPTILIPTSIYLQNLASMQPRTSLVKFARSPCTDRPGFPSVHEPQHRVSAPEMDDFHGDTRVLTKNSDNVSKLPKCSSSSGRRSAKKGLGGLRLSGLASHKEIKAKKQKEEALDAFLEGRGKHPEEAGEEEVP